MIDESSRPTLDAIARALGVSRTTVSNAFNRPDQLSPALRERVMATARDLGYAGPNPAARMLRTGRAGAIGLVFGETLGYAVEDPAAIALLRGVAAVCEEERMALLLLPALKAAAEGTGVRGAAVDGFLLYALPDDHPVLDDVRGRRLPVAVIDDPFLPDLPRVGIDDRAAARQAAEHLLDLGHRRIGIVAFECGVEDPFARVTVSVQPAGYRVADERLAGYGDALAARGLDPRRLDIVFCPANTESHGAEAARRLLARTPRPTALLAMSDRLALGAMAAARNAGLSLPRDLSVVGFDDAPAAAMSEPPLTTIRQPLVEKGIAAARLILGGGEPGRHLTLPTELVVRASTARAPRA